MDALSTTRLFLYCAAAAVVGVPLAVAIAPDNDPGGLLLLVPIAILALLMFVDGYRSASNGDERSGDRTDP
ncbi:hypothetical protein GRS48_13335 [Halorubrum sp. JWXQ-INN 858]|uniref:hypothetical protein n=1 Tax=Halorubrum sp. JWXQ-INN 858 TaxID=2690782 RepID=UPI00135722DB|nr:hypothetical protein [Halorubrum sp. JWXQ-INN 858]MWV65795.1 hypothetical protein [Halorubrum sp. JWXQ-INN 858]